MLPAMLKMDETSECIRSQLLLQHHACLPAAMLPAMMVRNSPSETGSRMPHIEQVSRAMFELKILESSGLTEVLIYGSCNHKLRAKWMLQSMAERYRLRQERGMLKLEEAMKTLELGQCLE
uniref:KH-like RNA-binding domain-containing protein n=1 Tax=Rattus norvegicus TaxID=10116 RepID=A0ABK0LV91_RAT